ncbi:MAG: hypothetical protein Q7U97_09305 [Rhodocyclaceae bacterium]|nr:hypothetical protein [Rhodocyclaceae bacterium]
MNPLLIKSYAAAAAIAACRFVKHGATDGAAIQATDASVPILGVSEQLATPLGDQADVVKVGLAYLELGDTVVRGNILIPDALGRGIPATIVAGTEQHAGAVAEVSGVVGDIIPVQVIAGQVIATDTGIATADITVSTAELLALNATPKTLVAAPGAGMAVIPVDVQLMLDFNSAAYNGIAAGEDLEIRYTNGAGQLVATVETTGFLDAVADAYRHVYPASAAATTPAANAALVLALASGEIATGNSPLKLRVRYRTVALAL